MTMSNLTKALLRRFKISAWFSPTELKAKLGRVFRETVQNKPNARSTTPSSEMVRVSPPIPSTLLSLPFTVLLEVFMHLEVKDVLSFAQVCCHGVSYMCLLVAQPHQIRFLVSLMKFPKNRRSGKISPIGSCAGRSRFSFEITTTWTSLARKTFDDASYLQLPWSEIGAGVNRKQFASRKLRNLIAIF